jgi:hypothetical protein
MDCKNISKKSLKSNTAALWLKIKYIYSVAKLLFARGSK